LPTLLRRVEDGENFVVSRAGKPVAKLVPLPDRLPMAEAGDWEGEIWLAPEVDRVEDETEGLFYKPADG
jgi:prevent-host-death family protein